MNKTIITKEMFLRLIGIARVIFFILGVILCFSTHQFFSGCKKPQPSAAKPATSFDAVAARMLVPYDRRISELSAQNAALRAQVSGIETALSKTKRKAASLEQRLQEQISTAEELTDTAALLSNCDSLQETALLLLDENEQKDSLYQELTGTLYEQVAVRDSALSVQTQQYGLLLTEYDRLSEQEQQIKLEYEQCQKQYRRQRTKSRLLTAGLVIIGGSATGLLLRR